MALAVGALGVVAGLVYRAEASAGPLFGYGPGGSAADIAMFLAFGIVGTVVLTRLPRNRVGWLLGGVWLFFGLGFLAGEYAAYGFRQAPHPRFTFAAAWFSSWSWIPALGMVATMCHIFPTGNVLSARWRIPARVGIAGFLVVLAAYPLKPGPLDEDAPASLTNPVNAWSLGGSPGEALVLVGYVGFGLFLIATLVGAVGLVVRFVRAEGVERYQLKWFATAATVFVASLISSVVVEDLQPDSAVSTALAVVVTVAGIAMPVALGIAISKYRLYDIDVVISKTLVFGGLAAFITAIYVGVVVGVGTLLGAGDEPNLALSIVATAVVAVAFQPVRERLTRVANRLVFGRRATPYEVLSRFSSHLGETLATEDTLQRVARLLVEGTGATRAQVWLRLGGQLRVAATHPEHMTHDTQPEHLVDVVHEGERLGALSLDKQRGESLTPTDRKLVDDLAAQAGLVLRNVRLTEELKARIVDLHASRQRLVAAQDAERRRLERDLRDGAQRELAALQAGLEQARVTATAEQATKAAELLGQVAVDADDAISTLRDLAHGIFPPLLAAEGLARALRAQTAKSPLPVVVESDGIGRYDPDVEAAVYFCVLEAVNNAAKYADPDQVTVRLTEQDGQLTFAVTDDGTGFDPATTPQGHGLTNMTDRLDALDGQLHLRSEPATGTTVAASIPLTTVAVP